MAAVSKGERRAISTQRISDSENPEGIVLTEAEVQRSFNKLFKTEGRTPEAFEKAEQLLDQLRAESPLRHRLSVELEELRKLCERK
ncbi:MAG: hypothetical protein U1A77_08030 [Pirellulales bacterium]